MNVIGGAEERARPEERPEPRPRGGPTLPIVRTLAAAAAIALAMAAQRGVHDGIVPGRSLALYGIAIALFVAAAWDAGAGVFAGGRLLEPPAPGATRLTRLQLAGLAGAVLATSASLAFFGKGKSGAGWIVHLLALAAFAVPNAIEHARLARGGPRARPPALALLGLAGVLAVAFWARTHQLDRFPFGLWFDEASSGNLARQINAEPGYRPVFVKALELPAHFSYLVALSFRVFGDRIVAMRLVGVFFGMLSVVLAFVLFRRWFGDALGLLGALFLAVLRYHLVWSRFGVQWGTPVPFELLVLWLLDRALEKKRSVDFAWLGLAIGAAQLFYFPVRFLVPIPAVFLFAVALVALRRVPGAGMGAGIRTFAGSALLFAAGGLVVTAPVIHFAATHRQEFFERTTKISIFSRRDEPDLAKALKVQTLKHLLMFQVRGDGNARHNLPGEPMLDPTLGALAVLGAALAFARADRPSHFLMLLTFGTMILGGILSVDFEAPQSLRSIGVIGPLVYFALVPLAAVWRLASSLAGALAPGRVLVRRAAAVVVGLACLGLAANAAAYNFTTYFDRQQSSAASWLEHSTAETIVGNEMVRLAPDHTLVVSATYRDHPTVHYLAHDVPDVIVWRPGEPLSLPTDSRRAVALLFDPQQEGMLKKLERAYPKARFRSFRPPMFGPETPPLVFEVLLSPEELRAAQGAEVRWLGADRARVLATSNTTSAVIDPATAPKDARAAELRSVLDVPRWGEYRFFVSGRGSLFVDERPADAGRVELAKGSHVLRLAADANAGRVEVRWVPAGGGDPAPIPAASLSRSFAAASGLLATYFKQPDPAGEPAFRQIDPEVNFYFHILQLNRPYSIEWTGKVFAPEDGTTVFATDSIDESKLFIDGQLAVANPGKGDRLEGSVRLAKGWHDLRLDFWDHTGSTRMYLWWQPPGGAMEILPSRFLSPPRGRYPDAPEPPVEKATLESVPYETAIALHVRPLFGKKEPPLSTRP